MDLARSRFSDFISVPHDERISHENRTCGHFLAKVCKSAILARLSRSDNRWFIEALNRSQERPSGTSKREESPSYTGQSAG